MLSGEEVFHNLKHNQVCEHLDSFTLAAQFPQQTFASATMGALMVVAKTLLPKKFKPPALMDLLCIGCLNEHPCAADSTNAAREAWAEKHLNTVVTVSVLL